MQAGSPDVEAPALSVLSGELAKEIQLMDYNYMKFHLLKYRKILFLSPNKLVSI